MNRLFTIIAALMVASLAITHAYSCVGSTDSIAAKTDTVIASTFTPDTLNDDRYTRLTDADYRRIADELGIEVATIKAVSDIEAGKSHVGFFEPGKPVINFDRAIFTRRLSRAKINITKARASHPVAFAKVNVRKYGSYGKAQYARLQSGMEVSNDIAKESTFWGMFQIGGFNWRKCGAKSVDEFVDLMSESEAMQLELFARFIRSNGMDKYLKTKNWSAFARAYNGGNYAKKRYHKRLAAAYAKYSKKQ